MSTLSVVENVTAKPIVLRRYVLPSVNGEGWAVIVLGSDGFFAAVSDYGNYAFRWPYHGTPDFRLFFMRVDAGYLLSKIATEKYDGSATAKAIRDCILESRRHRYIEADLARKAWDDVGYFNVEDWECGFSLWCMKSELADASEYRRESYSSNDLAFANKTVPRLVELLRTELAVEVPNAD